MIRFFNPGKTYQAHKAEFDAEIQRVLNAGDIILRSDVEKFEKNIAEFVGTKYAVGLNSGTDALYLALRGLRIGTGDEVLVPSRTFVATPQAIVQVGAKPVFYDLEDDILSLITEKTKAIMPVHIEGALDTHYEEILDLAELNNLYVIDDAAQALGALYNPITKAQCWSFYPAKILGSLLGDAGALTTNDEKLYNWVKGARNHFKETAEDYGVNSRLDNVAATCLNVRFKYLPEILARRKEIAIMYLEGLKSLSLGLPENTEGRVWQDFLIRTLLRDKLFDYLKEKGIETMKNNYPFPVPKLPLAQQYEDETLRIPCNENLTNEEIKEVIRVIHNFYDLSSCQKCNFNR